MPVHFLSDWFLLTGAFLALAATTTAFTMTRKPTKFKAAVYAHNVVPAKTSVVLSRAEALAQAKKNLDVYSEQVKLAKEQGAEIVVFPEDGIEGVFLTRDIIYPFLEEIPDPRVVDWSPCQDPTRYNNTDIVYTLSCMASQQSIYVVANMGDKQPCNATLDPACPPDGRYQYNTAVAFGPDGRLLARYHKANLFAEEEQFDAAKPEVIYFDTSFGRFGIIICYDVFVYDPAVVMVTQHQIANVIFTTAWSDALPLLSAVGFHSSFARTWGVNFLAANIQKYSLQAYGSGIYGPDGMKAFYYNNSVSAPPKLVITELDVLDKPQPLPSVTTVAPSLSLQFKSEIGKHQTDQANFDMSGTENNFKIAPQPLISDSYESSISSSDAFDSILFGDEFTFVEVDGVSGNKSICSKSKKVCCYLDYAKADATIAKGGGETDLFAFGVFDGLHTLKVRLYFQICALVRCADSHNKSSCGAETTESSTVFKKIEIRGNFETPYLYPEVILHAPPSYIKLAEPHEWSYDGTTLLTNSDMQSPVVAAGLLGRVFSRDNSSSTDQK